MSDLPVGWAQATLGELVSNRDSERVPVNAKERAQRTGSVPYYGAAGKVGSIDASLFNEELLLLGEDGVQFFDPFRPKAYLVSGPAWVNNHAHVLSRLEGGPPLVFLKYYLDQFDYHGYANGTTRLKLTRSAMDRIPVPVPPLAEQERIVAVLDRSISLIDDAAASLDRAAVKCAALRVALMATVTDGRLAVLSGRSVDPALLKAAERRASNRKKALPNLLPLEDRFTLPDGWTWVQLGDVTTLQQYGSSAKTSVGDKDAVPVLRMGNLQGGALDWSSLKYLPGDHPDLKELMLGQGDLLFNRTNSPELVGKSAVYRDERPVSFASYLIRLRFEPGVLPEWVAVVLNSPYGRAYMNRVQVQQVGQANVNGTKLAAFPLPLPPVEDQQALLGEMDRYLSVLGVAERSIDTQMTKVQFLRRSVLDGAFTGRLVPQEPTEESAAVLLERLKSRPQEKSQRRSPRKPKVSK